MSSSDREPAEVVARLSREEKVRLLSGADFWRTEVIAAADIPSIMLADGPHGLRKQAGPTDHLGLADAVPATCFPTASALGSSWDLDLLERIGAALGREAAAQQVGVLLGPGLNLVRHPAGGRSFEYLSDDPLLGGRSAAALIRGIQSEGVGACAKHYVANAQESDRLRVDHVIDERTLRELYLRGFEIAVAEGRPWTVMSAYNKVNGEHVGESRRLLTTVLREEWGFDGVVISDWFAVADRVASLRAGLDLEMPGSGGTWDAEVLAALEEGTLAEADVDAACARIIALTDRVRAGRPADDPTPAVDPDAHHDLAREAAATAATLLANDGLLPLTPAGRIALVGAFAGTPRYQGAGSSKVTPTRVDTLLGALTARLDGRAELAYAAGYDPATGAATAAQIAEARAAAAGADVAVLVIGLPASLETEGVDRNHLRLPDAHVRLVEEVTAACERVVVVLCAGAAVEMPWADLPDTILLAHLGGQAGGSALADVLLGDLEPRGRLATSWPISASDLPADGNFAASPTQVLHRENLFVGARFHDTFGIPACFPLGHGLGYTTMELGEALAVWDGTSALLSVPVRNAGDRPGRAVVQVYAHRVAGAAEVDPLPRPEQWLAGFAVHDLDPGQEVIAEIEVPRRSLEVFDVGDAEHDPGWALEAGTYELRAGFSSTDVRTAARIAVASNDVLTAPRVARTARPTDEELAVLLGRPVPTPEPLLPYHRDSALQDLTETSLGRMVHRGLLAAAARTLDGADPGEEEQGMAQAFLRSTPLRVFAMFSRGRIPLAALDRTIAVLNGASPAARRAARR